MRVLPGLVHALALAATMTWQIGWSLILGFTLAAIVHAARAGAGGSTGTTPRC